MNNPKAVFFSWLLVLAAASWLSSCRKFLELEPSPVLVENEEVFSSDATAQAAVAGLYSQLVATNLSLTNGGCSVFPGLAGDELVNNANANYEQFSTNAISRTNTSVNTIWRDAYKNLYQANAMLLGLQNAKSLTPALQQQLMGEVKFLRAFCYTYLVGLFGDVPLVITTSYKENAIMARTPVPVIYEQLTADLATAADELVPAYPGTGRVRANRWAALSLLARIQLYRGNWKEAADAATLVIQSGAYKLSTDLTLVFLTTSEEAIWQLMRPTSNTAEAAAFLPVTASAVPVLGLRTGLLQAFEPGDRRRQYWVKTNSVNGKDYSYPYKYRTRSGSTVNEYLVALRLAEQYLVRAEANARQGLLGDARDDLNTIRERAGLPPIIANDEKDLLEAISQERRIELFAEWGHRWFDLKRTAAVDSVMGALKGANWQPTDALFPIPQEEIDKNGALVQNPGY